MPEVAAVRLTYNPKVLWFDPNGVAFRAGDALIVRTERGLEYGVADEDLKTVDDEAIRQLKTALKPVERLASMEDTAAWNDLQRQADEALPVFKQMVSEQNLDMHPVAVEFLFDGDKAIFYFESEDRVDFRDLVRQLAARFHMRIDMRQIGVRDNARIVGGFGHCGQELCCARMGGEFAPVSIRMAKDQDLSLNPQKISGVCGRLMCCLRYEADVYKEFKQHCPKANAVIHTPKGDAKVVEINVPCETVTIMAGDKRVKIPIAKMEIDEKTGRPGIVPEDVYEEAVNGPARDSAAAIAHFESSIFTGTDKVADKPQARRNAKGSGADKGPGKDSGSRRRRRGSEGAREIEQLEATEPSRTARKRRGSHSISGGAALQEGKPAAAQAAGEKASGGKQGKKQGSGKGKDQSSKQAQQRQKPQGKQAGQQKQDGAPRSNQGAAKQPTPRKRSGARPGQKSSALADARAPQEGAQAHQSAADHAAAAPEATAHRRPRRRTHKGSGASGESAE